MTEFGVGLPRYGRRPPVRLLPPLGGRGRRWRALRNLFLVRCVLALPEDPVEAFAALLEPVRKVWRLLVRLWAGPGMRGGWQSDAGRLLLAVHGAYWSRDALRTDEPSCYVGVAGGTVTVRATWLPEAEAVARAHAGVRVTPWPRALRRRVDIAFPDGSWLTVRAAGAGAAGRLRARLVAGVAVAGAGARAVREGGDRSRI
ncbi:hypothetical protein [Streptomyces sp. CC208A]|uniref:hypothetical protein n=1 Tax=Streptomyces sp. CC208A TaxID=3044573 RepID=UPI0024A89EFB|nr:hypothetical protein [Streptomyces sp. CC208A]